MSSNNIDTTADADADYADLLERLQAELEIALDNSRAMLNTCRAVDDAIERLRGEGETTVSLRVLQEQMFELFEKVIDETRGLEREMRRVEEMIREEQERVWWKLEGEDEEDQNGNGKEKEKEIEYPEKWGWGGKW